MHTYKYKKVIERKRGSPVKEREKGMKKELSDGDGHKERRGRSSVKIVML